MVCFTGRAAGRAQYFPHAPRDRLGREGSELDPAGEDGQGQQVAPRDPEAPLGGHQKRRPRPTEGVQQEVARPQRKLVQDGVHELGREALLELKPTVYGPRVRNVGGKPALQGDIRFCSFQAGVDHVFGLLPLDCPPNSGRSCRGARE